MPRPEPFAPKADPDALEDLRARLRATRWPDAPEDAGWSLGTDVAYLRELVTYWADEFDWRAQEAALNRLPHLRVTLDGLGIHVVHAPAAGASQPAMPLILGHGWPDSFWRYTKVLPLLTDADRLRGMSAAAARFGSRDADVVLARQVLAVAAEHRRSPRRRR